MSKSLIQWFYSSNNIGTHFILFVLNVITGELTTAFVIICSFDLCQILCVSSRNNKGKIAFFNVLNTSNKLLHRDMSLCDCFLDICILTT